MKINYQKILDEKINDLQKAGQIPKLLLHSCCGPCSSYVLEYLARYFKITIFYYNPNIFPEEEYYMRVDEQQWFVNTFNKDFNPVNEVDFMQGVYDRNEFHEISHGKEDIPEGGERCFLCYELRLRHTGEIAKKEGFDFFSTTLSISPMKNAAKLNEIGKKIADELGIDYLFSDFKKRNGYKRSIEISKGYGMYRQEYCGCEFSIR